MDNVDDAGVESLNDAEAEAVLLALGRRLTWRLEKVGVPAAARPVDDAVVSGGIYVVSQNRGAWWKRLLPGKSVPLGCVQARYASDTTGTMSLCPHPLTTLDTAKAACECHYATGRWE